MECSGVVGFAATLRRHDNGGSRVYVHPLERSIEKTEIVEVNVEIHDECATGTEKAMTQGFAIVSFFD